MTRAQRKYQKALETLVYIANKERRSYWVLKTIYFADKEHLRKYGRQIFDEIYYAMKQGPVPSLAYDILKNARGDGWSIFDNPIPSTAIKVPDNKTILPLRQANTNLLSRSEIDCLDYACERVKGLTFSQLKDMSHDNAYDSVDQDEAISLESIIRTLDNSEEILDYINCN